MNRIVFFQLFLLSFYTLFAQETDSIIDIRDGQIYNVVKIGKQWWMQENLNTGIRIDGMQNVSDNGIIEKYCYNDLETNCDIYGGLYQWDEMMDYDSSDIGNPGRTLGICPAGWHLPTDSEWTELTDFLGGESVAGGKLKETGTAHWFGPNMGATNESGFTVLPGGTRHDGGSFGSMGADTYIWSSAVIESNAWFRRLGYDVSSVTRSYINKEHGFAVRCLSDSSQFSYLTISDKNLKAVSTLYFTFEQVTDTVIIINSEVGETINVSSIYLNNTDFKLNRSSAVLASGDSIHLTISFNPPGKGIFYDTLFVESDDPYNNLIKIPIIGIYTTEIPCGVITENTTWTKENSPYYLGCNLTIAPDFTLTINHGVTVIIDSMKKITVDGRLLVNGNDGDSVVFKGFSGNYFDQIYFRSTGSGELSKFIIQDADIGVGSESDSLFLINGLIRDCRFGLQLFGNRISVKNTTINQTETAIYSEHNLPFSSYSMEIESCIISNNIYGIDIQMPEVVELNIFENRIINNNVAIRLELMASGDIDILNNELVYNDLGITANLSSAANVSISNNTIAHNLTYGITIQFIQQVGGQVTIHGNQIYQNNIGIEKSPDGDNLIINENSIYNNILDGIVDGCKSTISYNRIVNNGRFGLVTSSLPLVNYNSIYSNAGYNLKATKQSSEIVNAENNYWGSTDQTEIASTIYDYYDDGVTVIVDFQPFLEEEIQNTLIDFASNEIACLGDEIPSLNASGDSVRWYNEPDYSGLLHIGNSFETGESVPGIYTYYVTQSLNDTTVLRDTSSLIISTNPVVNSVDKTNETTCNSDDGSITIDAVDNYSLFYSVDGGGSYFDNDGVFAGLSNGNYPVLVKNEYGCAVSGGIVEIISEGVIPPVPEAGKDTTYCIGDDINDLFAISSSGGTLTWYSDPGLNDVIDTGPSFSPPELSETITYYITETKDNCESPSTHVIIEIKNDPAYEDEELCLITIDLATGKNLLVWEKSPDKGIASYNIYRETFVIGQYDLIGNVPFGQLAVFADLTSKPEESQNLYKITAVDSCGNESENSSYHKPLFLQYVGSTGGVNLQWSDYEIEGGDVNFITYEIYRGQDPAALNKIADVSASLDRFTDTDSEAFTSNFFYRVAGVKAEACDPTGILKGISVDYERSMSNLENNEVVSVTDQKGRTELNIYPNPFNQTTTIRFNNPESNPYTLYVMDLAGKVYRIVDDISTSEYVLERGNLREGLYFVELRGAEILRGKIVIE